MKCNYETLMEKVGIETLSKDIEVTLEVLSDLPDCRKINTRKYVSATATDPSATMTPVYNRYAVPENVFECMRVGCINTGTLVGGADGNIVFKAQFDATEFAAGVVTFYVNNATASSVDVMISSTSDFTNADKYTVNLSSSVEGKDGYTPIIVDLSKVPTEVIGTGWEANRNGAFISISTDATMGISSIAIFDSMDDFATSTVVKIGCLTELGTDFEIDAAEATCLSSGYDTSTDPTIERTIVGNKITPNYWILNPFISKGKATEGFAPINVEKVVEDSGDYGTVVLADINLNECGWITAAIKASCNVYDAQLDRLTVPAMIDVNEKQYFAIANDDGGTTLYFNKALVGNTVIVSYPQLKEVEELIGNYDNIGTKRVRYNETITLTDGTKLVTIFDNILITSFPFTINEDETEFSFTINVQRGNDGHVMRQYRIID